MRGEYAQQHQKGQGELGKDEDILELVAEDHELEYEVREPDHLEALERRYGSDPVLQEEEEEGAAQEQDGRTVPKGPMDLECAEREHQAYPKNFRPS